MTSSTETVLDRSIVIVDHFLSLLLTVLLVSPLLFLFKIGKLPFLIVFAAAFFCIDFLYFTITEHLFNGQTVMKRYVNVHVVSIDDSNVSLRQVLIRNILRYIDALPGPYVLGAGMIFISSYQQRLGDLVAGTVVTDCTETTVNETLPPSSIWWIGLLLVVLSLFPLIGGIIRLLAFVI